MDITKVCIYLCPVIQIKRITFDMIRQEKIKGTLQLNVNGFTAKTKLRTRTYKTGGACIRPKSAKANKIIRAEHSRQNKPLEFMRIAEDAKKKEFNRKRNAKKYAKRNR